MELVARIDVDAACCTMQYIARSSSSARILRHEAFSI